MNLNAEEATMKTAMKETIATQLVKKQRLDREFAWIAKEFKDFRTVEDIEFDNVERYAKLHLGYIF